jgi:hypothetical protein
VKLHILIVRFYPDNLLRLEETDAAFPLNDEAIQIARFLFDIRQKRGQLRPPIFRRPMTQPLFGLGVLAKTVRNDVWKAKSALLIYRLF